LCVGAAAGFVPGAPGLNGGAAGLVVGLDGARAGDVLAVVAFAVEAGRAAVRGALFCDVGLRAGGVAGLPIAGLPFFCSLRFGGDFFSAIRLTPFQSSETARRECRMRLWLQQDIRQPIGRNARRVRGANRGSVRALRAGRSEMDAI
jgi:hypothetical protein